MDDRIKGRNPDNDVKHRSTQAGDEVGEAAGGVSGVVVGAAIGSIGGPLGAIVGGIAGAAGGWWAGRAVADAAQEYSLGDDAVYRNHFENSPDRVADREYETVSPAYQVGHIAARNPEYNGRSFDEIEPDLRRGWISVATNTHGDWNSVRGYARDAYDRSRSASERQQLRDRANIAAEEADKRLDTENNLDLI
jgi:hypothetical protein